MNPRVTEVQALSDYKLEIKFDNSEIREFDVSPYLDKGIFQELKDPDYFKKAFVEAGTVTWPNEQDFCPDTLFEEAKVLVS